MRSFSCLVLIGVVLLLSARVLARENVISWEDGKQQRVIVLDKSSPDEITANEDEQRKEVESDKEKLEERQHRAAQEEILRALELERLRNWAQNQRIRDLEQRQRDLEREQQIAREEELRRQLERQREIERAYFIPRYAPPPYVRPYHPHWRRSPVEQPRVEIQVRVP